MTALKAYQLSGRGYLKVSGEDRVSFLQGLVSNDVEKVTATSAGYGALLTPQGKFLFDFFMIEVGDALLIETEADRIGELYRKLRMFKLRSKVELEVIEDKYATLSVTSAEAFASLGLPAEKGTACALDNGIVFVDPRLVELGARLILPTDAVAEALGKLGAELAPEEGYHLHRIRLGVPDGSKDLVLDKTVLLEAGFEELGGVDFQKGCYMGQELTARTKYRGLVKRRLLPVEIDGPAPNAGAEILLNDKEAGELRSTVATEDGKTAGIAMIRLNRLSESEEAGIALKVGEATVTPFKPAWAKFQTS